MAKNTKTPPAQIVVNNLVIKAANRATLDISNWRTALTSAERGRRTQLYDLYDDVLLDNVLSDAIEKRIEAITNADIVFANAKGESVPELDKLIDSSEFETLLKEILGSRFWGCSLVQVDFTPDKKMSVWPVPRKHIRPKDKMIAIEQNDEKGYPFADDDRFIFVGSETGLGLILRACPYVIYKRGDFGDWAQFAEVFGMPFRKATYNSQDEQTRLLLEKAMEQSGSASYAVIPNEANFDIIESKTNGNGQLYNLLRTACNEEILVGILGQTMTTLNGSSRSQSETHMDVQENKHKSDRRYVQRILNEYLIPLMEKRGLPVQGGWFSFPEKGESISLKERATIDLQMVNIVDIPADYFYDTYGYPKPKDSDKSANKKVSEEEKSLAQRFAGFFVKALRERAD